MKQAMMEDETKQQQKTHNPYMEQQLRMSQPRDQLRPRRDVAGKAQLRPRRPHRSSQKIRPMSTPENWF
ncbi:hypothetical protein TIFTF001_027426 [Ficus carica]|uniref:Uncharacterized protein n=1 Tax=Ficus carica TaxID=3494 RepID=A0AA88DNC0_FICCA|nr:hypothetical protein TIFTF001_027426 [Ficus carica]